MLYIENEGALFRSPSRSFPREVWNAGARKFEPYRLAGQPKPIEWGHIVDDDEARRLME